VSLIVVLVVYPLSFGPLIWLDTHDLLPGWTMPVVHAYTWPLFEVGDKFHPVAYLYEWYTGFWRSEVPRGYKLD